MRGTLFGKLWDSHIVATYEDGSDRGHIERRLVYEITPCPPARARIDWTIT